MMIEDSEKMEAWERLIHHFYLKMEEKWHESNNMGNL